MLNKHAINNVLEKGFDSRAQMRYLLRMAKDHPEKYSWVFKALKEHGVPKVEGPLHTYWEGPYQVSPETPSYTYTGRTGSLAKLIVIAQKLDNLGSLKSALRLSILADKSLNKVREV